MELPMEAPLGVGNAAVTEYVPPQGIQPASGGQGVKGVHEAGGKTKATSGGGTRGAKCHSGSKAGSGPVETAAAGPAAAERRRRPGPPPLSHSCIEFAPAGG
jgi:hypothetical protein